MIGFNEQEILRKADLLYSLRGDIEAMADKVCENDFENVLITSSGGSLASLEPYCYMMKTMSKIPVLTEIPAELILTGNALISDKTIAVMTSKSGDTRETVAAAKWLREKNVKIISFCGVADSPLAELSDYSVCYGEADPHDLLPIFFFGKLLYNKGEFDDYPQLAEELKNIGNVIASIHKESDEQAKKYAALFDKEDKQYQIWISSGNTWGPTYSMAMCVLEECQWLKTKSVNSADFFHGTIELVEKDVLVCVGIGEGPTRPLDQRVINFVKQHTNQLFVFDTKDYTLEGISEKFRWLLSPVVLLMVYYRISHNVADIRKHTMDIRRYYRRLEY